MERYEKRGLSPIIATVMLISLALVLALIILIWAKNFIGEKAQKFGEPIENACDDISFVAEAENDPINTNELKVSVNNIGNVPLYGLEIRKTNAVSGSVENIGYDTFLDSNLPIGDGKSINFVDAGVSAGDTITVVPIILGETDSYKKPYTCDGFGTEIDI